MRYRVATAETARVLPTLDGPLAVEAGEVVLVVVGGDEIDYVVRTIAAAESVRRKLPRGKK